MNRNDENEESDENAENEHFHASFITKQIASNYFDPFS